MAAVTLTSVLKFMDNSTFAVIQSVLDGTFTGGTFVANIANNGVGLATPNAIVPAELIAELETIKADVIAGKVEFNAVFKK